jgi:hypothetical protein
VIQIFHNGQPSHGGDHKIFEVMASTLPRGNLGSVASLLAEILYQGIPDFVDSIYPIELQIKDTKDTYMSALFLDLHLEIDIAGRLKTKLYNKTEDFNFPIVS